ncbi:isoprenylcysteine carboxylmethyltransferase family protein [Cryomorphaceae bacterium 1068]|nr:isoprenylcysteine carboxylmethyltransferase family protein [Cryomorphaceae bacterium 1068]
MNELVLGVFWMIYYVMHSAMATSRFKLYLKLTVPTFYPYYRFVYSTFASVNFLLLLWLHLIVSSESIFDTGNLRFAGYAFCLASAIVLAIAGKAYGSGFLFREEKNKYLIRSGLNAYVRHPLYFGILLFLVGIFLIAPNWKNLVFAVISTLYLIVGTLLEERKLIDEFGEEYLNYRKEVKMLIPWVF